MSDLDQLTRPVGAGGEVSSSTPIVMTPDELVRANGIFGLIGVAVIHFAQVVPTFDQTPWLGAAFVLLVLACVVLAAGLLHRGTASVWTLVAVVSLCTLGGFVFTRVFSTGFDNQDVGNWSETLGVAALFIEGLLVVLSLYAIRRHFRARPRRAEAPA